ncbi:MAG: EAL domain-containing protein [Oscillospiraceae bacterium]|jgi:predicted signal transduction protein with EAL and GGDEF domain|nr:EAL domain-containing protein [Oscillospiraceae bacterium]
MEIIGIILMFAVAIIVIVLVLGILRVERRADQESGEEPPPEQEPEEAEELVNLVDYYSDFDDERREIIPDPQKAEKAARPPQEGAKFDKLCNLKVGRGYLADCQQLLRDGREAGQQYLMICFDYNRFRFLNSLKGYASGDYALTRLAQEAQAILPFGAMLTRLSADHFAALFPFFDEGQIEAIHEQLKRTADQIKNEIGVKSGLTICMGVSKTATPDDYDVFKLLRRANIARHCMKLSRGEALSFFDEAMITSYLFGESALEDYNDHQYGDDFTLLVTPQLRLQSRRVTGCDSRAVWNCEQTGDNPSSAGESGFLVNGNFRVAWHVCRAMSRWRKAEATVVPAMIHLSETELFKQNVDDFFIRLISEFQLDHSFITVVISLHTIRLHPEIVRMQLNKLRSLGIRIAVRDIDRAFNAPELLESQPVDCLKLHKSFTQELDRLPENQQAVLRVIDCAKRLGAETVFEGSDSSAVISWLAEAGGTMAQGRYVGDSMTPETFVKELHGVLAPAHYDPNATVIMDDVALNKGDYVAF